MHKINVRKLYSKTSLSELRTKGHIPGILSGQGTNLKLYSSEREIERALRHKSKVYRIQSDYFNTMAKLVEVRKNPYTNKITHFSLERIPESHIKTARIPVELTGIPKGVKQGGFLARVNFNVKVRGELGNIPEVLHADASYLEIGDDFTAKDLRPPNKNIKILDGEEVVIARCELPTKEKTPLLETDFTRDIPRGNLKHNSPYTSLAV